MSNEKRNDKETTWQTARSATSPSHPKHLTHPTQPTRRNLRVRCLQWTSLRLPVAQPSGDMAEAAYIMRFNGSSWQEVPTPRDLGQAQLSGLAMISPTQGWAVGATEPNASPNTSCIVLQYQNGVWENTRIPFAGQLNSVSMVSASEGWAVGFVYNSDYSAVNSLLLHYHNGAWSV